LLSYEADQLQLAQQQAQNALDTLTRSGINQGISWAQYVLARIFMVQEDWDRFQRITQEGIKLASHIGSSEIQGSWFAALQAQVSMLNGDLHFAERWAESQGYTPQDKPNHWVEYSYFTYVRLLIVQDRIIDAKQLLKTLKGSAQSGKRTRKLISVHLLMALTELAQQERSTALDHLEQALSLAAPENYRRVILDEGPLLLGLLPEVRSTAPKFVDELFGKSPEIAVPAQFPDSRFETLSERELEVVNLVARGYSNRQIAEALFVTLGTVKKHLNNIFSKLQVKNRTQAVARARDLGLLG
jgi:LuxR family maltose regulon positive regulatory protein